MPTLLFETDEQRFARCYEHARGYYHRAELFVEQSRSASLVFNVAAIAVESYLIALCSLHNIMPFNHNYRSLLTSAADKITFDDALWQHILALDTIFGICSIDDYHHGTPDEDDKIRIMSVCHELNALIDREQSRLARLNQDTLL